jgi:hypothetical protein
MSRSDAVFRQSMEMTWAGGALFPGPCTALVSVTSQPVSNVSSPRLSPCWRKVGVRSRSARTRSKNRSCDQPLPRRVLGRPRLQQVLRGVRSAALFRPKSRVRSMRWTTLNRSVFGFPAFLFGRLYPFDNEGAVVGTNKSMTGCILVSNAMAISLGGFNRRKFQDHRPLDGGPL